MPAWWDCSGFDSILTSKIVFICINDATLRHWALCYKATLLTAGYLRSEVIRGTGFTQGERFVTETELGQIDGITPQAALPGWCKSLRC